MEMVDGTTKIEVKLTTSGRYLWTISSVFPTKDARDSIRNLKSLNEQMKDQFPDHAKRGSGRITQLEE